MKKLTIVFSFLFVIASYSVSAQSDAGKFDNEKFENSKELKSDMKQLYLSSGQVAGFKEITKKYIIKYEAIMESNNTAEERTRKISKINDQKKDEMKDLLNDEQFETYVNIQTERETALKNLKKG